MGAMTPVTLERDTARRESALIARFGFAFWLLEGFLQVLPGFLQRALGVVVGLQSLAILVSGALALPRNIKNLA